MPPADFPLVILNSVDSTNNYAMARVHEGLAKHGNAYFSYEQTGGKGQRGKSWQTGKGENIALSLVLAPKMLRSPTQFQLSMAIALACFDFFSRYAGDETTIKWPNDIYWRDRKAGGILIETVFRGRDWKWAIAGIGVNINQGKFEEGLKKAVSLKQVTGKQFDLALLAGELYEAVMKRTGQLGEISPHLLLEEYNQHLFKLNEPARLNRQNESFDVIVKGVNSAGQLLVSGGQETSFNFGEVEWVL